MYLFEQCFKPWFICLHSWYETTVMWAFSKYSRFVMRQWFMWSIQI